MKAQTQKGPETENTKYKKVQLKSIDITVNHRVKQLEASIYRVTIKQSQSWEFRTHNHFLVHKCLNFLGVQIGALFSKFWQRWALSVFFLFFQ